MENLDEFLKEIAIELTTNKISNPTHEQIAEAMLRRINRQGELYAKLFAHTWHGPSANRAAEFLADMGASVYEESKNRAAR